MVIKNIQDYIESVKDTAALKSLIGFGLSGESKTWHLPTTGLMRLIRYDNNLCDELKLYDDEITKILLQYNYYEDEIKECLAKGKYLAFYLSVIPNPEYAVRVLVFNSCSQMMDEDFSKWKGIDEYWDKRIQQTKALSKKLGIATNNNSDENTNNNQGNKRKYRVHMAMKMLAIMGITYFLLKQRSDKPCNIEVTLSWMKKNIRNQICDMTRPHTEEQRVWRNTCAYGIPLSDEQILGDNNVFSELINQYFEKEIKLKKQWEEYLIRVTYNDFDTPFGFPMHHFTNYDKDIIVFICKYLICKEDEEILIDTIESELKGWIRNELSHAPCFWEFEGLIPILNQYSDVHAIALISDGANIKDYINEICNNTSITKVDYFSKWCLALNQMPEMPKYPDYPTYYIREDINKYKNKPHAGQYDTNSALKEALDNLFTYTKEYRIVDKDRINEWLRNICLSDIENFLYVCLGLTDKKDEENILAFREWVLSRGLSKKTNIEIKLKMVLCEILGYLKNFPDLFIYNGDRSGFQTISNCVSPKESHDFHIYVQHGCEKDVKSIRYLKFFKQVIDDNLEGRRMKKEYEKALEEFHNLENQQVR